MTFSLSNTFSDLDQWLALHKPLWDVQSFHHLDWPWQQSYPALCEWLAGQTSIPTATEVERALHECVPGYQSQPQVTLTKLNQAKPPEPLPSYFSQGIKGRKWQQIQAFSQAVTVTSPTIEWCAGKGHLGKVLAYQHQTNVHSLEWQASLCQAGMKEAQRLALPQQFSCVDVLKGEGGCAFESANSAVALHACGDLHRVLIERSIAASLTSVAISPCCYHLTHAAHYQPLSQQAQQGRTCLSKDNLKLAVKEVATASAREQRIKQLELRYRLGFDSWQREQTQQDQYLTVPSCSKALLSEGFGAFCKWAAAQKGLRFDETTEKIKDYEQIGHQRSHHVALIESVTQHFRQPLELWLVLDRALRFEEAGYQVTVSEFCEKSLTPRNLLICAQLSDNAAGKGGEFLKE